MTEDASIAESFKARSFALLIGIDQYQNSRDHRLQPLKCAKKDVQAIARVLEDSGGFLRQNITLLCNQDATRNNILNAFASIQESLDQLGHAHTAAKTRFLFYFSGHGLEPIAFG